ncbi:MFS transporter [Humibacter ginsenosidimutans]|uniref:MFS transporter n=1 Tax=Humibacter ginsenosidimutans TaxID=2599293 RepID=A0A5B8LZ81_9MICO|nr:MFS transporter [Humibacter ginsenosidimutans]QDZ13453.1 MFS transporter [Humibacter ginsenosidimutans]
MTLPISRRPLWAGRTLALLGILLVAANLRTAVTALSPILDEITRDVPFGATGVGLLGALPPICFAVFGLVAPLFTRKASLEVILVVALAAIVAGHVVRGLSVSFLMLTLGSVLTFAGMAVGNVLLPPLVKRYFPDRIGLLTSLYATVLSVSTLVPPLVAVEVADSIGWRYSVGMWSLVAVLALLPWVGILLRSRESRHVDAVIDEPGATAIGRIWHAPLAWAMAITFAVSSLNAYAMFAWLPELLHDTAASTPVQAGGLLSLYSAMGIPAGLLIPVLAARMRNVGLLVYLGIVFFVVGYVGLLLWPAQATWLWVVLAGLGPLLFPLCLVLINLRTSTHEGAVALSGFTQGLGYVLGALGPLVVGVLHDLTHGWLWPIVFLLLTVAAAAFVGVVIARPGTLESHFAAKSAREAATEG